MDIRTETAKSPQGQASPELDRHLSRLKLTNVTSWGHTSKGPPVGRLLIIGRWRDFGGHQMLRKLWPGSDESNCSIKWILSEMLSGKWLSIIINCMPGILFSYDGKQP